MCRRREQNPKNCYLPSIHIVVAHTCTHMREKERKTLVICLDQNTEDLKTLLGSEKNKRMDWHTYSQIEKVA